MLSERVVIAGMDYDSYDADNDPSGDIGHALASAEVARRGGSLLETRSPGADYNPSTMRKIAVTALTGFSRISSSRKGAKYYRNRLVAIERAGFEVPPFNGLPRNQVRALYGEVLHEIRKRAGQLCPDVLDEVDRINSSIEYTRDLMR